jgi:hypothetical protein
MIGYLTSREVTQEPPDLAGSMFDYVLNADGLYLHARRDGLEVYFPIAPAEIRGVAAAQPHFRFDAPKVSWSVIYQIVSESAAYMEEGVETLFHLCYSSVYPWNDGWELVTPEQERARFHCRPLQDGPGSSHDRAIIEIHSHHTMPARFSSTDDTDETGFRLYAVVGRLNSAPEIRLRVGCYGYFWEIPAEWALELPEGLHDCNAPGEEEEAV